MNETIDIYGPDGQVLYSVIFSESSYRRWQVMGEHAVTLNFSHAGFLVVPVGSYITFKGQRYTLYNPSNFTKNANRNYAYTLKLEAYQATMADSIFINKPDGRTSFSRTARPHEFLESLVDNLNREDSGWTVGACIEAVPITIQFNETSCAEALRLMAEAFKTEWEVNGKQISLRKAEYFKDAPLKLQYGQGKGFKPGLGRGNFDNSRPINRLFVRGGERNIDYSTYGSQTLLLPAGQSISYDGAYFSDQAGFDSSISRTYQVSGDGRSLTRTDADPISKREGSVELTGIYPMREGTVTGVEQIEVTNEDGTPGYVYDFFDSGNDVDYAGLNEDGKPYRLDGEQMMVVFQTGMLSGREFSIETDSNGNLTGYVHTDPAGDPAKNRRFKLVSELVDGFSMPGGNFVPVVGDKYALFGMRMPLSYIRDDATKSGASWDLFREAVRYKFENEDHRFTFKGEMDGIWAQSNWDAIEDKIIPGGYVDFSDPQFQPKGVLIRISAIKDYLSSPYKPELELTNVVIGGGLRGELSEIPQQEVVIDEHQREIRRLEQRRWRDVQELRHNLGSVFTEFSQSINPVSVASMQFMSGNPMGQFRFVMSRTSNTMATGAPRIEYDSTANRVRISGGASGATAYIQHQTLGIEDMDGKSSSGSNGTSLRPASEYRSWSVPSLQSDILEKDKFYWVYARVSKTGPTGVFLVETTARTTFEDGTYYYLVVGGLNSEQDGTRSFAPLFGFTEILPGQITTGMIRSSDGYTYFDLSAGNLHVGDGVSYLDWDTIRKSLIIMNAGLTIGTEISLNPDGSGHLAGGKINWDAGGTLYVDDAVIENSTLTNVNVSGELNGVTGSFRSLNCVDGNGNIVGGITFGTDGMIWLNGDIHHQSYNADSPFGFYGSIVSAETSFAARARNTLVVYGTYAYYYPAGLDRPNKRVSVGLSSSTSGGQVFYKVPLVVMPTGAYFLVDLVIFSASSTYYYELVGSVGKTVKVVNANDGNNEIYIYTNGYAKQLKGGSAGELINASGFLFNPTPSTNSPGAGWLLSSIVDNDW